MPKIPPWKNLSEAACFLRTQGENCATVAAHLYAAGLPPEPSMTLLIHAGFAPAEAEAATAAPYGVVNTSIVARLKELHAAQYRPDQQRRHESESSSQNQETTHRHTRPEKPPASESYQS